MDGAVGTSLWAKAEANGIKKPRFMTELPALIESKGLTEKMPDYIEGSRQFKKLAYKVFLDLKVMTAILS